MAKRPKGAGRDGRVPDIQALEMMLDYAIMEGADLRLPLFVLLLRAARLELMVSIGAFGGPYDPHCDQRVETRIKDRLGPVGRRPGDAIEQPLPTGDAGGEPSALVTQDR
jgi:hypothetical protein